MSNELDEKCQDLSRPRKSPKTVSKEGWQAQLKDHSQRRSGIGKPVADEERLKIDFRVQGVHAKQFSKMQIEQREFEDADKTRRI